MTHRCQTSSNLTCGPVCNASIAKPVDAFFPAWDHPILRWMKTFHGAKNILRKELILGCLFLGTLLLAYSGKPSTAIESKVPASPFVGKIIEINWNIRNGMLCASPCYDRDWDVATGMLCIAPFQSDDKEKNYWVHPSAFNNLWIISEQQAKASVERQEKWAAEKNAPRLKQD